MLAYNFLVMKEVCIFQHLQLDQTSKVDPFTLLQKISMSGISQDVCINDLGMEFMKHTVVTLSLPALFPPLQKKKKEILYFSPLFWLTCLAPAVLLRICT